MTRFQILCCLFVALLLTGCSRPDHVEKKPTKPPTQKKVEDEPPPSLNGEGDELKKLKLLVEKLKGDDPAGRAEAAKGLGDYGAKILSDYLKKLEEFSPQGASYGAWTAWKGFESANSMAALHEAAKDKDEKVRATAKAVLVRLEKAPYLILMAFIQYDSNKYHSSSYHTQIVHDLVQEKKAGEAAILALKAYKDKLQKIESISYFVEGKPYFVGKGSGVFAENLGSFLGDIETALSQLGPANVDDMIACLTDPMDLIRIAAIKELAGGKLSGNKAIPELLKLLKDKNPVVRSEAVSALIAIDPGSALPGLLSDDDPAVRLKGIDASIKVPPSKAVPELLKVLKDKNLNVRSSAIAALLVVDKETAFTELLNDNDPTIRLKAVAISTKLAPAKVVPGLLTLLKDNDPEVRFQAAVALVAVAPGQAKPAVPILEGNLKSSDLTLQRKAACTLVKLDPTQAKHTIPVLIKVLIEEVNLESRVEAAHALGQIGPAAKEAIPYLQSLSVSAPDVDLRKAADAALKKIQAEK